MIIDNVSPMKDDSPFDKPSHSDLEMESRESTFHYRINLENLPKPVPFLGYFSYGKEFTEQAISKIRIARKEVGRPLNQDEIDAMVYWLAKRQAVASWGTPVGFAGGAWKTYKTMKTFNFPFWKPNMNILQMILHGPFRIYPMASFLHTARFLAYGLTGKIFGDIFFGSYAVSVTTVGATNDPRLRDFMVSFRQRIRDNLQQQKPIKVGPTEWTTSNQGASGDNITEKEGFNESYGAELEVVPDSDSEHPIVEQPWSLKRTIPLPTPIQSHSTEPDPFDLFGEPSSSEAQNTLIDSGSTISQQTSSWERIRRGEQIIQPKSINSTRKPKSKRVINKEVPYSNEKFSYSKAEEERMLAKEESQAEFDARIERERSGNFM